MHGDGGYGERLLAPIAAAASIVLISGLITHLQRRKEKPTKYNTHLAPLLDRTGSGRLAKIERFSHYLVRQMGFEDGNECPHLIKLADEYLKRSKAVDEKIYEYLTNQPNAEELYVKLVEEFERCIVGYFGFHWSQAPVMINQVLSADYDQKKLKNLVMAATRKQRFEKITKNLKVTRVFSTLVEEMKAIGTTSGELNTSSVMAPVALSERCPVLLLMGGGMGAGKSTVLKDIMKESFWSRAAANAVVVEADAFKETDVIYRALSSSGHHEDMLQTAELVHQSSTDAASSLLVTALNEGRDVIMDGTLSWVPFVEQTITMARNVHKHRYRMGEGYKVADDGTVTENYWVPMEDEGEENKIRNPYRIELVGVVCDAYLAVVRGIRRAIQIGRAVRVKSQLKSHKRFASAFPRYCELVDNARLYCTNSPGGPPKFAVVVSRAKSLLVVPLYPGKQTSKTILEAHTGGDESGLRKLYMLQASLIAWKDGNSKILVDTDEIKCLDSVTNLNDEAECIFNLHKDPDQINKPGSVWKDMVLLPTRPSLQLELKTVIKKIEIPVS